MAAYSIIITKYLRKYIFAVKYFILHEIMPITMTSQKSYAVISHQQIDCLFNG